MCLLLRSLARNESTTATKKKLLKAAESLIELKNNILKNGGIAPTVLCVICGMSNAAYVRPDGVFVVPITALKNLIHSKYSYCYSHKP